MSDTTAGEPKHWQVSAKVPIDVYDAICQEARSTHAGNVSALVRDLLAAHVARRPPARAT